VSTKYISCAETAKLVRKALKEAFPGQTFYVRSNTYAGGASIDVTWLDGPTEPEVDHIVQIFSGKSFDGSIDMGCYWRHWMLPDGTIQLASGPGTSGSMGYIKGVENPKPHPDAVKVSLGANYVFAHRYTSKDFVENVAKVVEDDIGHKCEIRSWSYSITKSTNWKVAGFAHDRGNWVNERYHLTLHWATVINGKPEPFLVQGLFHFWEGILQDNNVQYNSLYIVEPLLEDAAKAFPQLTQCRAELLLDLFLSKELGWTEGVKDA